MIKAAKPNANIQTGFEIARVERPAACKTTNSPFEVKRLITYTTAAKPAMGAITEIIQGRVRAVNSRNTIADWPSAIKLSNNRTARLTQ